MSRLSFRPRPLDIHKKLPILKSNKEFEDEESPLNSSTRNSHILRFVAAEAENEVHHVPSKKNAPEIPTPESVIVDTYERDYSSTFIQPTSYLRARGARAEIGEFVEYDLDKEDEDWLEEFNGDKQLLTPEKFENMLFKLEVLDHRAREKAGVTTPTPSTGSSNPVLQLDVASEALQVQSIRFPLIHAVYNYWKEKRGRWQKPILRRLQPPPPVNDTNPYNVFRPREKAHKLHTRRMQRRENNVQSFEKLRQVRRNLEQAKTILEGLIKREEKKRDVMESEVSLQRIQLKYRHESELVEDSLALSVFPSLSSGHGFSGEEYMDSDDVPNSRLHIRSAPLQNHHYSDTKPVVQSMGNMKREFRRRHALLGWLLKLDPDEQILLFTKPLVPDKLAAAGIIPPTPELISNNDPSTRLYNMRGRIGRGGRIIFERWNPLAQCR